MTRWEQDWSESECFWNGFAEPPQRASAPTSPDIIHLSEGA